MKKIVTTLALLVVCSTSAFAANSVRISQLYGGGGNTGATYSNDYIELFNNSGAAIDISGWSLQYQSSTSASDLGTCVNCLTVFPAGSSIPSCGYFLIQLACGTTVTNVPLPVTPDYAVTPCGTAANNMSATSGKIALRNSSATGPCSNPNVDLVGWGPAATCFETAPTAVLNNSTMLVRGGGGVTDNDNNATDFALVANAVPRNSQSPQNTQCLATPTTPTSWGNMKALYR
jgi:hypothetical protein